ncbi:S-layer homology domain-containing protein [Aneurinibacillus uraniidurans]|uniref:S-layer homology domain-containing protein n=1 Tax=Aneurinibacillus uraniidurans TaxID=2966586 RepID=UPI002349A1DC|nr:S-layer homology domain-containing protein [Aneurinibacillus sp. B1]WCN39578.1 S-layer homology domain-containing protein [Aneurinibacillus sp. B1]
MNKKKILKVLATGALLSSCAFPVYAVPSLQDIGNSYAKEAIQKLVSEGIINGKGDGTFDPTGKISRQDFAIILARALALDTSKPPATPTFSDVPADHYSYAYIEAAVKAGLVAGVGDGKFGNGQSLSRQDMAVIFVRALGVDATGKAASLSFKDAGSIADYAKDAVAAALELGLIKGNQDGTFNPQGNAERQAVALVASKFLQVAEKQKNQTPAPTTPTQPTQPKTPIPTPVTNSNTGGSGGGGGGGSSRDVTAPTVTLVSSSSIDIGNPILIRSNEVGTVYLVLASVNTRNKADLEREVSENRAKKAPVVAVNADTRMNTEGLEGADYHIYAVDNEGNVSAPTGVVKLRAPLPGNQIPVVTNKIQNQVATMGDPGVQINLREHFADPDGDPLDFTAVSDNAGIASVYVTGDTVVISPVAVGKASITGTASDRKGDTVSETFNVTVRALKIFPQPRAILYVHSGKKDSSNNITLVDDSTNLPSGYQYNKHNLKNYVQVGNGQGIMSLQYNADLLGFKVIDNYSQQQGTLTLKSSDPSLLTVAPGEVNDVKGVKLEPQDNLSESSQVTLTAYLWDQDGKEIDAHNIPLVFDQTAPTFGTPSYNSQCITIPFSEPVVANPLSTPLVEYSPSGTLSTADTITLAMPLNSYEWSGNRLEINIQDYIAANQIVISGGKFRITIKDGAFDYANNPLQGSVECEVNAP